MAARLRRPPGPAPGHLADALGIPGRRDRGQSAEPSPSQLAAICTVTSLAPSATTAMFTTAGPVPSPRLLHAWMPQRTTGFCPACLAEDPGQIHPSWSLPVTFFWPRHGQLLAICCPHCGRKPASMTRPSQAGHCGGRDGCGARLDEASPPGCADVPAARHAHEAISGFFVGIRDPGGTAASRSQALSQLIDVTIIAFHLAAGNPHLRPERSFTPGMLNASTFTTAFTLLTRQPDDQGHDPLASLVTRIPPGTVPPAVPLSWRGASHALRTRIARIRDPWLRPPERLRYATTLPVPRPPVPRPPGHPDLAGVRAARLPDQLWPDWAIRLTDDGTARHDKFLSAALIALLLPHSDTPLHQITTMVSGRLRRHVTGYHMGKLTEGPDALRILTELAFALDAHDIPIDYQRRRDLAASTTLIDDATWTRMIRAAGMRLTRGGHARRYLYELLTGRNLNAAPQPYRLTSADSQARYNDFIIGMPASLATALTEHARRLLGAWGIDEPCNGSHLPAGSPPPAGPGQTPRTPTPPPSTTPCSTDTPRPARSQQTWASPSTTCARSCGGTRCPGPAARSGAPSSPKPRPPARPLASSPACSTSTRPGSARNTSPGTGP